MKEDIKELTEGMQSLCAIANRIVTLQGGVSRIEKDLLLDDLRRLYDIALNLRTAEEEPSSAMLQESEQTVVEPPMAVADEEMLSSTVMATMAAMGVPEMKQEEPASEPVTVHAPEPVDEPQPEPEPAPAPAVEPVPEPVIEAAPVVEMPKMEDLELNGNSLLFDEVIIEEVPESQPVEEVAPKAPKTPKAPVEAAPAPEPEPTPKPEPEPAAAPDPEPSKAGSQASLLDYLKRPVEEKPTVRTLGDTLGEAENNRRTVEDGLNKKVSDLRTVININDKFSFMSELFHNNMKAYNDFILRLNSIDTRDEALLYVNEVSAQNNWDENSLAVQSFYKVFDKKF